MSGRGSTYAVGLLAGEEGRGANANKRDSVMHARAAEERHSSRICCCQCMCEGEGGEGVGKQPGVRWERAHSWLGVPWLSCMVMKERMEKASTRHTAAAELTRRPGRANTHSSAMPWCVLNTHPLHILSSSKEETTINGYDVCVLAFERPDHKESKTRAPCVLQT